MLLVPKPYWTRLMFAMSCGSVLGADRYPHAIEYDTGQMSPVPAIGVVVVSWNTRDLLAACLDSLKADADDGRAEVIVVDNASTDGSPDLVRERYPWVTLVEPGENLGYGAAVNLGAARTPAAWIAAANADLSFAGDALSELLNAAARHPEAGAFAPRLTLADASTQHSVHPFPTLLKLAAFNLNLQAVVPGLGDRLGLERHWSPERERAVDWAHGAIVLVRREAWEQIGGFDAAMWMYAEDLDLAWRLSRRGWRTLYVPSAHVRHEVSAATAQAFGDERGARAQARTYAWMLRRRGIAVTRIAAAINVAGAGGRAALLTLPARLWPERYSWRRDLWRRWMHEHRAGFLPASRLRELR
jgi:N-acetylglucosaminyl-diphospho-decaprenol L-rhamnosyltransferase